ncbi:hypothetical protein AMELA_G00204770 [Ameiurus melas]|uniref:Uncharacterized protein n=1 Tax=Ameiurus melas TaxID=219545 RepID=A0A7J6A359_AMEME|nr:hypothetical protein AMELA_G00204770 [Ameiurus melas]
MTTKSPVKMADSSFRQALARFRDHHEGSRSLLSCLRRGARGIFFNESPIASRRHDVQLEDCIILPGGRILSSSRAA